MRKIFGYRLLGQMLQGLADACFKADQETNISANQLTNK